MANTPPFTWPEKGQFTLPPRDRRRGRKVAAPLKEEQRKPVRSFDMTIVRSPKRNNRPVASFSEEDLVLAKKLSHVDVVILPPARVVDEDNVNDVYA